MNNHIASIIDNIVSSGVWSVGGYIVANFFKKSALYPKTVNQVQNFLKKFGLSRYRRQAFLKSGSMSVIRTSVLKKWFLFPSTELLLKK